MLLSLPGLAFATPASRPTRPSVLLITQGDASLLQGVEEKLLSSRRYRIVLLQGLVPLMQQADSRAGVRTKAAELTEEGRKAMVALDQALAQARLTEALKLLRASFVRYYDPRVLAQVHLLLGALFLEHQARPDLARQQFNEVHHMDAGFTLDAHYSPRVRTAFDESRRSLPPELAPPPEDVKRLATLAGASVAMVLTVQGAGEQSLVQGSLFLVDKGVYTRVESRLVPVADPKRAKAQTAALGLQLDGMLEAHFPAPKPSPVKIKKKKKKKKVPPPPTPWYLRWYTLAAAGVVVTAAIVLPLTLRTKTSDVVFEW